MRASPALTRLPFGNALQAVLSRPVAALLPGSLHAQAEAFNKANEEAIEEIQVTVTCQILQSTVRTS